MIKVYYATHNTGSYGEGEVVLLDDEIPYEAGLTRTGYFEQIKTPEPHDGPTEGPDRARQQ
jgi:hypothetical protein